MKEKLIRFMYGRYGVDSLGRFLVFLSVALIFFSSFGRLRLVSIVAWILLIYAYFRIFSRNIYKRAAENQLYLNKTASLRRFISSQRSLMRQRRTHHIYRCPSCRQKIRIPRGKGKIEIRCPRCQTTFIKRS